MEIQTSIDVVSFVIDGSAVFCFDQSTPKLQSGFCAKWTDRQRYETFGRCTVKETDRQTNMSMLIFYI